MMDVRGYKSSGELDEYKYTGTYDGIVVACSWISETDAGKRQTLQEKLQDTDNDGNPKATAKPKVKVRINQVHTPDKTQLPDQKLPWADIDVPLTSGSGSLATGDTPQIKPGDAVRVRFKNGYIGKPVVIGLNYRNLYENISYTGPNPNPSFGLDSFWENSKNAVLPSFHYDKAQILPNAWDITYSHFDLNLQPFESDLDLPCPKRNDDANAVKTALSNLIKDVERIKRQVNQFAANRLDFINEIQAKVNKYAEIISGWISRKIKWLQEEILKKINAASVATSNALPLNARFPIREGQNILVQVIYCLFNKILDKITDALVNLLLDMIDRFITVPLCAIENLLTSLIGKILGLITSVLGAVASIIGQITGLVTQVLDFIIDLLSLFNCEPNDKCPEVNKWNLLSAAGDNTEGFNLDLNSIVKKAESFAQQVGNIAKTVYDPDTGSLLGVDIDDFDLNFNDVLSDLSCSGAPLFCGPPRISFFGGGGSGASGNTIISSAGELLGIDITSFGSGYSSAPFASIVDDCGKGKGAVVKTKVGIIPPELEFTGRTINSTTVELKWKTKRAKRVQTNFGSSELSGTVNVSPTQNTTYTVKAIGKYGQYSEKSLVIRVGGTPTIEPGDTINVPLDLDNFDDPSKYGDPNDPNNPDNGESGSIPTSDGIPDVVNCPPIQPFISTRKSPITIDPEDLGVVSVLVVESGYNYLPAPDGSLGGEGRTWANPEDTIVRRSDGKYELPYSPGSTIQLRQCDYVTPPGGDEFRPKEDTEYIAPQPPENYKNIIRGLSPTTQTGNYPVMLYICEVEILNPGIGYTSEDKIKITPDNGAQLSPKFDSNGALIRVDIISGGIGFTEFPQITVESKTGFNVQIVAKLCVNRIGDLIEEDPNRYSGQQIISVVDCVGKN
jgi:hypothetical protein